MKKINALKLEDFFSDGKIIEYKKNEMILRPEDIPQGIFYLEKGFVRMSTILEDGRELTLNIFKPGTYFSMFWAIADIENAYFFQAITDVVVKRIPKEKTIPFLKENPEILFDLTKRILSGMNGLLKNMEYLLSGHAEKRIAAVLILSAKRFGIKKGGGKIEIELPLTHQDIANLSGLTRETTSLELEKLKKQKLIRYVHHKVIIQNLKKLQEKITFESMKESIPYT
jgi:CRP-like cAMP-binding protein